MESLRLKIYNEKYKETTVTVSFPKQSCSKGSRQLSRKGPDSVSGTINDRKECVR